MSSLISTNDAALLGAMMATIGAIWAISLAAYQFIYRYFEETHREGLDKVKSLMDHGGKDPETLKWLHDRRTFLRQEATQLRDGVRRLSRCGSCHCHQHHRFGCDHRLRQTRMDSGGWRMLPRRAGTSRVLLVT